MGGKRRRPREKVGNGVTSNLDEERFADSAHEVGFVGEVLADGGILSLYLPLTGSGKMDRATGPKPAKRARVCFSSEVACRCFVRWVVPTGAGRQRYSVLGARDAATRTLIRETTDGNVNELTARRLLLKIRAAHPDGPISVVWDNARYQHTPLVRNIARAARIDLVYLPPYSPNLNLIERVWKFTKKTALANRTFADFAAFRTAIDSTLDQLATTHQAKMKSLLTLNFETLETASISTA